MSETKQTVIVTEVGADKIKICVECIPEGAYFFFQERLWKKCDNRDSNMLGNSKALGREADFTYATRVDGTGASAFDRSTVVEHVSVVNITFELAKEKK